MIRRVSQTSPALEPKPPNAWSLGMALLFTVLTALGVSAAGLALSYDAISHVGLAANMSEGKVWLLPVSVDGTMTVSTLAAMLLKFLTGRTPRYPMVVFVVCAGISAICNGMHAQNVSDLPGWCRVGISVIPALMGTLAPHLLFVIIEESLGAMRGRRAGVPLHVPSTTGTPLPAEAPAPAVAPSALGPAAPPAPKKLEMPPVVPELPPAPDPVPRPDAEEEPAAPAVPKPAPADPPHLELVGEADPRAKARELFMQGMDPKDIAPLVGRDVRSVFRYTKDLRQPEAAGA